jgi:hypothetical protein
MNNEGYLFVGIICFFGESVSSEMYIYFFLNFHYKFSTTLDNIFG